MTRGYAAIGLFNPKNSLNVGSVLRAAGCYEAAMVAVSGARPKRYLGHIPTDTQKAYRHMPLLTCDDLRNVIPYDCVPVAVDLIGGAKNLCTYTHPERAFYIFGPEDGTLGRAVTEWCRDVVYVPTRFCMNLAATVNVVLYDRLAKSANRIFTKESPHEEGLQVPIGACTEGHPTPCVERVQLRAGRERLQAARTGLETPARPMR